MQILTTRDSIYHLCQKWRGQGQRIALVPTMGCYHAGHEDLMRFAGVQADKVVVSLFVNPAQFTLGEDLAAYPRDLDNDAAIAASLGVDALFTPTPETMYAPEHDTWVNVPSLSQGLCGLSRPTHFQGVCTVVLKLFLLTAPHIAVFGEKDWQQLATLRRMVRDLNVPVRIDSHPTVREEDGLAMSSRNLYLTSAERTQAPEIRRALLHARELARQGETRVHLLREAVLRRWADTLTLGQLDYLSVVDADALHPVDIVDDRTLMACAVRIGKARLIDNILL